MSHSLSIDYTQNSGYVFHVSEDGSITHFEPRPIRPDHALRSRGSVVWAIGERLLHNYLLPRDCPRVAFYVGPDTSSVEAAQFYSQTTASFVVAIESAWLERAEKASLFLYSLPIDGFSLIDPIADYWISTLPITPSAVEHIANPLQVMTARNVELRVTPSLWPLREAVLSSTLCYSFIRMANAGPDNASSSLSP